MLRKLLKITLSFLANRAIRKHKIKIVVILGTTGSDIVKEMLYTVLKEKTAVRRNIDDIWWDLSVPINILGYKDVRRSAVKWMRLIISASIALLKNKSNPHLLILNAETGNPTTVDYWSSFLHPAYLVVLNYKKDSLLIEKLITQTEMSGGKVIAPQNIEKILSEMSEEYEDNLFIFGQEDADLTIIKNNDGKLRIKYGKERVVLPKKLWPAISPLITGAIFSVAVLEGLKLEDIAYACLKFTFPVAIISRIKTNLKNTSINI